MRILEVATQFSSPFEFEAWVVNSLRQLEKSDPDDKTVQDIKDTITALEKVEHFIFFLQRSSKHNEYLELKHLLKNK